MLSHALGDQLRESALVRAGLRLSTDLDPDHTLPHPYRDWIATCRTLLDRAVADGQIRLGLDPEIMAHFVISAFTGIQQLSWLTSDQADLTQRIDEMWGLLLPVVVANPDRVLIVRQARWEPAPNH